MAVEERADEARTGQASAPAAPPHRPFWPVALLLLGLIAAVLGAAFLLDRAYRPRVGVVAAPTSLAMGQPTSVPTAAGVLATASPLVATATAEVPATSTSVPSATRAATPAVALTPTAATVAAVPLTASAGTSGASGPPVRATVGPELERLPPLEREIADAYLRYWDVLVRAYYDVDTSRLKEVLADAELARAEEDIRKLQAEGRAASLRVELNFRVTKATPDEAIVYDEYINRSVYLDAVTKQKVPAKELSTVIKISSEMKKMGGVWKVIEVVLHD